MELEILKVLIYMQTLDEDVLYLPIHAVQQGAHALQLYKDQGVLYWTWQPSLSYYGHFAELLVGPTITIHPVFYQFRLQNDENHVSCLVSRVQQSYQMPIIMQLT